MPPRELEDLQRAVVEAAGALFAVSGAAAFCIPIPGTLPVIYVVAGEPQAILAMLPDSANDPFA
ncbi:hypothetical protein [Variovorax sp. dw_308]|uniref:hypothetical protein n=1 Tax=Variovorax sp. dw_308 TaxID=2721546 RepID=UPI001C44BF0A|nr:hypothetical protein [Variovorax sp. dw_308]